MTLVPLMTWPVLTLSIVLSVLSVILTGFILLHKGYYPRLNAKPNPTMWLPPFNVWDYCK